MHLFRCTFGFQLNENAHSHMLVFIFCLVLLILCSNLFHAIITTSMTLKMSNASLFLIYTHKWKVCYKKSRAEERGQDDGHDTSEASDSVVFDWGWAFKMQTRMCTLHSLPLAQDKIT